MYHPDCNPIEQQARYERLEALYAADGRHNHDHPMHCLFTGLALSDKTQQEASK